MSLSLNKTSEIHVAMRVLSHTGVSTMTSSMDTMLTYESDWSKDAGSLDSWAKSPLFDPVYGFGGQFSGPQNEGFQGLTFI